MKRTKFSIPYLAALASSALLPQQAQADHEPQHLEKVEVVEQVSDVSLTNPSAEQAKVELKKVPGATTLIDNEDFVNRANTGGMADILGRTPGVFSQSRFGGQESRISIRGSGITMTFGSRGIRYLRDGLPITNADGFTSPELIEPLWANYLEVYRGANALQYGAATLGGAVNFQSRTGRDYQGVGLNMVVGSHDYYRPQVMAGGLANENLDYFVSYSGSYQDGFRDNGEEDINRGYANFGYRWNERQETRLYLTAMENRQELPGSLTLEQFNESPDQANPQAKRSNNSRNFDTLRADVKHTVLVGDDDRLDLGGWYEYRRMDHPIPDINNTKYNNTGASFRYLQNDNLFEHDNRLIVGGYFAWGDSDGNVTCRHNNWFCVGPTATPSDTPSASRTSHVVSPLSQTESYTGEIFVEDRWELNKIFDLVAGIQGVYAKRNRFVDNTANPANGSNPDIDATEEYAGYSPKLGLIWKAADGVEVYTNASRSYEPPTSNDFSTTASTGVGSAKEVRVLDAQEGTTVELGVRGEKGWFTWDIAAYHTWLRDEILNAQNPDKPTEFITMNAKDSMHSGVEAGVQANIPLELLGDDHLKVNLVYNWTRFIFNNDIIYEDNYLPSIPNHFGMGELLYEHPSGFYIGPNMSMANNYFVDYANTIEAPAYTIMGARMGYKDQSGWAVFLEGRNLTDENWVSNAAPTTQAATANPAIFNPGYDRSLFAGVSIDVF